MIRLTRGRLSLAAVLLTSGLLTGCAAILPPGPASWKGVVEFAVVAPYSGSFTANGVSLLAGARAGADAENRAGGIDGYRVSIVGADERNASTPADLVADPAVLAVVGHLQSTTSDAAERYPRAGLAWLAAEPVPPGPGHYALAPGPDQVNLAVDATLRDRWGLNPGERQTALTACQNGRADGGTVVPTRGGELFCGLTPEGIDAALLAAPAGTRVLCVDGGAPELSGWVGSTRLDAVDFFPTAPLDPALKAKLANLRVTAPVAEYAATGYDSIQIAAAAARRADGAGRLNRAGVTEQLTRTDYSGLFGRYGPNGRLEADVEVRAVVP